MKKGTNRFQEVIPTLKLIGISDFIYMRVTTSNKFFVLGSNDEFVKRINESRLLSTSIKKLLLQSKTDKLSVALLNDKTNSPGKKCNDTKFKTGISIALPFKEYIDIFSFFADLQANQEDLFYLRHFGLLKRFIIFFRLDYKKEIELLARNLLDLKESITLYSGLNKKGAESLENLTQTNFPIKSHLFTASANQLHLTDKEKYYLSGLSEGKNIRVIAKELHISPRSIESSLEMLKAKTGYRTKSELLKAFIENQYQARFYYDRYY